MKIIEVSMNIRVINALRKVAYGGDSGDGVYHDRSYLLPSGADQQASLKLLRRLAEDIRNGGLATHIIRDDGSETPVRNVYLSKYPYAVNDIGELDQISADKWLKLYTTAASDKDRLPLSEYQYMQYEYGDRPDSATHKNKAKTPRKTKDVDLKFPWWFFPAVAGVAAVGGGLFFGARRAINHLANRL